jgi:hypothetical protein
MHYYGTYCLARSAGLTREASRIIATAAQFVDDNAQKTGIELADASSCEVAATAHHAADISNINAEDQRKVWVPFHFLPGNEGQEFTEKLICRKDSSIAKEMCENHLSQNEKTYFLPLIGIMAHVYGDTFAHYGFSGVSSRKNRVDNDSFEFQESLDDGIKSYILDKKESFFSRFSPIMENIKSTLAENLSGALGHGAAVTFPDRPYLEWRFNYEDGIDSGWHNNLETFLEFSQKIHQFFHLIAEANPSWADVDQFQEWQDLEPKVEAILRLQGRKGQRVAAWKKAAELESLFNIPESIPIYENWNEGFESLASGESEKAMKHPIYGFYQAASYHRWYVLRDLLPKHGLMVA